MIEVTSQQDVCVYAVGVMVGVVHRSGRCQWVWYTEVGVASGCGIYTEVGIASGCGTQKWALPV